MAFYKILIHLAWVTLLASCNTRKFEEKTSNTLQWNEDNSCIGLVSNALLEMYPGLKVQEHKIDIEFDCKEAALIKTIDDEMTSSLKFFQQLGDIAEMLPVPLVKRTFEILKPYCRTDKELYGSFCMAADVSAASYIASHKTVLDALPKAVIEISRALTGDKKIDFVEIVTRFPEFLQNKKDGVLLASFLGLDNNGVQTNRLKANLIFQKRWVDYASVFPYLSQYSQFQTVNGNKPSEALGRLLFSTRVGQAVVPKLKEGTVQTYKVYAGVYSGCRHALLNTPKNFAVKESHDVGYLYQAIKIRMAIGKPWKEFIKDVQRYDASGKETGYMMQTGAEYGYGLCGS